MPDPLTVFTGSPFQTNAIFVPVPAETNRYIVFDAPQGLPDFVGAKGWSIAALVLTHAHFDHTWDAVNLSEEHDCPIYLHPAERALLEHPNQFDIFRLGFDIRGTEDWQPLDISDHGETNICVAGVDFLARHVPGHSPGSVAFYNPSAGFVIGGDVLMAQSVGRTDLPGGSAAELSASIRNQFYSLPEETILYPGHGPTTTIGNEKTSNPFVRAD